MDADGATGRVKADPTMVTVEWDEPEGHTSIVRVARLQPALAVEGDDPDA